MKRIFYILILLAFSALAFAQGPAVTNWLQNTTVTGTYYISGNSIAQPMTATDLVNCQKVEYDATDVYVHTEGIPAYATGPFLDGNPSLATAQGAIFKFPLNPTEEMGTKTETTPGNIGVFINGVALFDWRDGVAWNNTTMALCGGPGNPPCPGGMGATQDWNRDAIPAEAPGFDCSKAHPAMGNYHHHQNPSAFKLDINVTSTICNMYDADGLYSIDATAHSPLLGFAYDGFPIYGAYGYKNIDGTGGITRMISGYNVTGATTRTLGPPTSGTYFDGYFREDYVFTANTAPEYMDEHNGRFCVTPEYPAGTYAYFCTVNADWTSAYPYVVGPTFYGEYSNASVATVPGGTTVYNAPSAITDEAFNSLDLTIFPNPSADIIAVQIGGLLSENLTVSLYDITGKMIEEKQINKGQTMAHFDIQTLYNGTYIVKIANGNNVTSKKIVVNRH